MDAELRQQPASDKGAQYPDNNVADDSKTGPAHNLTCQPACNETNKQYDQQAFTRHIHFVTSAFLYSNVVNQFIAVALLTLSMSDPIGPRNCSTSIVRRCGNRLGCSPVRVIRSRSAISSQVAALP